MSFLPVTGYEGLYEVGACGTVRSIDRTVTGRDGVKYPFKGRTLKPSTHKDVEYLVVSLWQNNQGNSFYVHRLVAMAHVPNPLGLPEVNHKDGCRVNNLKTNLEWVTSSENSDHAIELGLRTYTTRLTKDEFVECLFSVINGESYAVLTKRVPYQVPFLSVKLRKIAKELGLEADLDQSLYEQRVQRARINGSKNQPTPIHY